MSLSFRHSTEAEMWRNTLCIYFIYLLSPGSACDVLRKDHKDFI